MEKKKYVVCNVAITKADREFYKYMIIRYCEGKYWYYMFTNDLPAACKEAQEIGNGIVVELSDIVCSDTFTKADFANLLQICREYMEENGGCIDDADTFRKLCGTSVFKEAVGVPVELTDTMVRVFKSNI